LADKVCPSHERTHDNNCVENLLFDRIHAILLHWQDMLFYEVFGENCHQSNHEQTQLHGGDGFAFLELGGGSHLQGAQVQAIVIVTVGEVVDEVASH